METAVTGDTTPAAPGPERIVLETEAIRATLIPGKGFDVYEFIDVRTGVDVLFKTPWGWREPVGLPPLGSRKADWLARYPGGWQVLLPTAGDDTVDPSAPEGFHGEAAIVPWSLGEVTDTSAAASVDLLTAPLRLERTVSLEDGTMIIAETVINLSPVPQSFHWVHHPAFGEPFLGPSTTFDIPADGLVTEPGRGAIVPDSRHAWPLATSGNGSVVDLSRLPARDDPRDVFGTLVDFREGRYTIANAALDLAVEVRWELDVFPYAWFWQELESTEGYPWFRRAYVTAVEPSSLIPGTGEVGGHARGRLLTLDGHAQRTTVLTMSMLRAGEQR